jgi:GT2 family glycosyltransferase
MPELSVIIATYNRTALLERLLMQLDAQTLDPQLFEVVVVDDGSKENVPHALQGARHRYHLVALRQQNAGPAAARHRAIENALGRVLIIVDDDMQVKADFLEQHLKMHPAGSRRAVLGRLAPDEAIKEMPYFERWYARGHDRTASRSRAGKLSLDGFAFYTGNVSLRRDDYNTVGGFDLSLRIGEDTDLGLRLEKAGVELAFCEPAVAYHGSDHVSEEAWLKKARAYGVTFHKIGQKHFDVPHASALRYLFEMNPLARPLVAWSLFLPKATEPVSKLTLEAARLFWRSGLEALAQPTTSVVFTMEVMRGVRSQTGSLTDTARAVFKHWRERKR